MIVSYIHKISRRNTKLYYSISKLILKLARTVFTIFYYNDLWGKCLIMLSMLRYFESLLFYKTYLVPGRYNIGDDSVSDAQIVTSH